MTSLTAYGHLFAAIDGFLQSPHPQDAQTLEHVADILETHIAAHNSLCARPRQPSLQPCARHQAPMLQASQKPPQTVDKQAYLRLVAACEARPGPLVPDAQTLVDCLGRVADVVDAQLPAFCQTHAWDLTCLQSERAQLLRHGAQAYLRVLVQLAASGMVPDVSGSASNR